MKGLLCEMNREGKKFMGLGKKSFPEEILNNYEKRYMDFIASGRMVLVYKCGQEKLNNL